jgi:hypothetical protein
MADGPRVDPVVTKSRHAREVEVANEANGPDTED